ncbi:hypothetical protein B7494_g6146 [Chlorociboria aeruginascens]|nr:hypothetical protein B7494_g6146 [Chlorociboria aeruginascens]
MPPKTKSKARAFRSSSATKATRDSPIEPPAPFKRPSPKLQPFLDRLSKFHVYITHIDNKPRDFKFKIFLVPVFLNIAIVAALIWRISIIAPFYMKICFSLMGKYNEMTINTAQTPINDVGKEILRRALVFMIDLMLYMFIWPWPRDFFAGTKIGNPTAWRVGVGFRDKEIIVRRSRRWVEGIGNVVEEGHGQQLLFSNVDKAIDPAWMHEKTGYLMLNKEWDLDWRMMIKATNMIDKEKLSLDDFRTTVLLYNAEFGWMSIESVAAGGSAKEEEGRKKIIAFKEELTAMGKENLFFRWIELVQYESSLPGGFGPEQQKKTMVKAKELFEAQGVDFDKFWAKIGGMGGMPGMDEVD